MSSSTNDEEVLVVGAGPVGLSLAILLTLNKVKFRLVEKRTEPSTTKYSRAFAIHSRTQEIFRQMGLVDRITAAGRVGTLGVNGYYMGQPHFAFQLPPSHSSCPRVVGLVQSETERILEERLTELGGKVERGWTLNQFNFDEGDAVRSVELVNQNDDSVKETVDVRYVVGCDGGHSATRKLANIPFTGQTVALNLTCCDVELESNLPKDKFGNLFVNESNKLIMMIWITDTTARLVYPLRDGEPEPTDEDKFVKMAMDIIGPADLKITRVDWLNTFKINERRAEHHFAKNVYLCGDAAHVHSPAGGQGMNTGIQDAYNLAWKLALAINHRADLSVLNASFHDERSKVADQVLANSGRMVRTAFDPPKGMEFYLKQKLLGILLKFDFVSQRVADSVAEVMIEYDHGPLTRKRGPGWLGANTVPGVGLRMPNFSLFPIDQAQPTDTHHILKGCDQFELLIYIPAAQLNPQPTSLTASATSNSGGLDNLRAILSAIATNPTILHYARVIRPNLIVNQPMFNLPQWLHLNRTNSSAATIGQFIAAHPAYLDQSGAIRDHYQLDPERVTLLFVRPDGHVGKVRAATPQSTPELINKYFAGFLPTPPPPSSSPST